MSTLVVVHIWGAQTGTCPLCCKSAHIGPANSAPLEPNRSRENCKNVGQTEKWLRGLGRAPGAIFENFRMVLSQNRQALVLLMAKGSGLVLIFVASLNLGNVDHTLSTKNDGQACSQGGFDPV